jgi:hypothetical protein
MDCVGYFECMNGVMTSSIMMCHGGLLFNTDLQGCDWAYNTQCSCTTAMFPPTTARPTIKPSAKPSNKPNSAKPSNMPTSAKPTQKPNPITTTTTSTMINSVSKDYYPD